MNTEGSQRAGITCPGGKSVPPPGPLEMVARPQAQVMLNPKAASPAVRKSYMMEVTLQKARFSRAGFAFLAAQGGVVVGAPIQ